jgi:hypothetical protein
MRVEFLIEQDVYAFEANNVLEAMAMCNRQVVDRLNIGAMAWMDVPNNPNQFRLALGNFFD